ncbi:MAG: O-antigen ligase domain-containing protein [Planctomycetaceae bacterium]
MAYVLFLLANFALFVRPSELSPMLEGVQLYLFLIIGAVICAARPLQNQLARKVFIQQPINLCVVGVLVGVAMSHLSLMYLYGLRTGVIAMSKTVVYYLLLVALVNTPQRLRRFLMCTAISASVMIAFSVKDYFQFVGTWDGNPELYSAMLHDGDLPPGEEKILRHVVELNMNDTTDTNQHVYVFRMRGFGIFNDPNDVAILIVVVSLICHFFLTDKALGPVRHVWWIPLGLMVIAMYCTQSRGGILATGVAGTVWLATKYGGRVAIGLGALIVMMLPLAAGRIGDIALSSGTGQSRIQLWGDGLAELVSPRILFGVGEGMYQEYARLVAHNSYVHAFVEMGIFGGTFFFGCLFFPAYAFFRMHRDKVYIQDEDLRRLRPYMTAILASWCMGLCSLSRCYVESTYMIIGVSAAYINLAGFYQWRPRPILMFNRFTVERWLLCSACLFVGCFVFVRIFARYSG